jgi:hypothetical protein
MSGNSPENVSKDFEELFASFSDRKVRALIVGGYAFAYHARPRYTKDIDVWIEATPDNAQRLSQPHRPPDLDQRVDLRRGLGSPDRGPLRHNQGLLFGKRRPDPEQKGSR